LGAGLGTFGEALGGTAFGEALGLAAWTGPVGVGITFLAAGIGEAFRHGQELSDHTEHEHNFLLDGLSGTNDSAGQKKVNEDIATALSSDAAQESSAIQEQLELNPDQMQQLATRHPDILEQGRSPRGLSSASPKPPECTARTR
jgi:hypothetical protein